MFGKLYHFSLVSKYDCIACDLNNRCFDSENSFNTLVSGSQSDATGISYELANMETVRPYYFQIGFYLSSSPCSIKIATITLSVKDVQTAKSL